jgi:zinc/manganese transport system ATP-binding protein
MYAEKVICLNKKIVCSGEPEKAVTPETLSKLYGPDASIYLHEH